MEQQAENPSPRNRRELQIQGPRPSPLRISKDSHKISKKPPIPPLPKQITQQQPPLPATGNQPIIIYSVSPKPIFVDPSNFRSIVQHLTGNQSTSSESAGDLPVSPAARYASIERTSPIERNRREERGDEVHQIMMNNYSSSNNENNRDNSGGNNNDNNNGGMEGVSIGQNPGILSPAPANLPAFSAAMFSPMSENQLGLGLGFGMNELMMSPFMSNSSFMPSPNSLFNMSNAPIVSPSPSSLGEFFNIFDF